MPMTGTARHTDVMVTYKYRQHCKIKQKSSTIVENSKCSEISCRWQLLASQALSHNSTLNYSVTHTTMPWKSSDETRDSGTRLSSSETNLQQIKCSAITLSGDLKFYFTMLVIL